MRHVVKTLQRPDSLAQVKILDCENGLFVFEEAAWTIEDHPGTGESVEYWLPTYVSGYYQDAKAAEADARAAIPWLREKPADDQA